MRFNYKHANLRGSVLALVVLVSLSVWNSVWWAFWVAWAALTIAGLARAVER